jgi:hypothetical protein
VAIRKADPKDDPVKARIARRLAALERLEAVHKKIIAENGGELIDVDSVLEEMREGGSWRG